MLSGNDSSHLSEAAKSEQPLRFDEELDPPSIAADGGLLFKGLVVSGSIFECR